jgi:hypothetical protein
MPTVTDRPSSDEDLLLCPLCEYDLRGQVEPRCPECGYQFLWDELRDPARRMHRYLFEHHPERNVWSFVRTFSGSLRPRRFWRELFPTQTLRTRRLLIYCMVLTALLLLPAVAVLVDTVVVVNAQHQLNRIRAASWIVPTDQAPIIKQFGSVQAWVDLQYPVWPSWSLIERVFRYYVGPIEFAGLVIIAWPWLTMAALMIFQASMRRAQVKPAHVMRCVVYSAGGLTLASVAIAGLLALAILQQRGRIIGWYPSSNDLVGKMLLVVAIVLTYQLWIAYRKYLRFDHALATALASQVIVALLVWKLGLDTGMLRW